MELPPSIIGIALDAMSGRVAGPAAQGAPRDAGLWEAESLHRSNNLSHLASSLAHHSRRRAGVPDPPAVTAAADLLAAAYAELGIPCGEELLPSIALVRTVSAGLVAAFGGPSIRIDFSSPPPDLFLTADRRRALVLIASELVVNALKHAFPNRAAGVVSVAIRHGRGTAELVVSDDGCGPHEAGAVGTGTGLLDGLASILDGILHRGSSWSGGSEARIAFAVPGSDVATPAAPSMHRPHIRNGESPQWT